MLAPSLECRTMIGMDGSSAGVCVRRQTAASASAWDRDSKLGDGRWQRNGWTRLKRKHELNTRRAQGRPSFSINVKVGVSRCRCSEKEKRRAGQGKARLAVSVLVLLAYASDSGFPQARCS